MRHVTKYCNVIGPHCTVQWDTAFIHSSPDPFLFYAEVGLAYASSWEFVHCLQVLTKTHDGTLTFTTLTLPGIVSDYVIFVN